MMMRTLLLTGTMLAVAAPASAQPSGAPGPRALAPGVQVEIEAPGGAKPVPGGIDETALRYYARIGDVARLEAEIARLRAIDPTWKPPADLFAPQPVPSAVDETPLWSLVSAGKTAEARAAIAEERRKTPSWRPSDKLLAELDLGEATQRLRTASDAKNWQEVIDAARAEPRLLTCNRLDNLWRTAEAHGELKQTDEAFELFRTAATTCAKASERRDTLFKASRYLPPDRVRALADLAVTGPPAPGEDYSIVRNALVELDVGRTLERLGAKGASPPSEDIARAEANVTERRDAGGALALGWFHQNRKDYTAARDWFTRSNEWNTSDQAAEGLILALAGLKRKDEALAAAAPWRGKSERVDRALRAVVAPPAGAGGGTSGPGPLERAVAARDWGRCLTLIERERRAGRLNAALAQQRGWCLMELNRPTEAEDAFAEARTLAPKATPAERRRITEESEYGSMLARMRLEDPQRVLHELPESGLSAERQRGLKADGLAAQAQRAYEEQRFRDTLRLLDARSALAAESRGLTLMRGWSLYNLNRPGEALDVFEALDRRLSTADTRQAVTATLKALYGGE